MTDTNAPAYPVADIHAPYPGLTKREAMAMHIMAGIVSHEAADYSPLLTDIPERFAADAVRCADALLAELARTGK